MTTILLLASLALAGSPRSFGPPPQGPVRVVSVYDGDTFTLETGDRVRLLWANTPELKPKEAFGEDARDATRALVLEKTVDLTISPAIRDGYGRLLAAVQVDGKDLATELVRQGLAHVFVVPPETHDMSALIALQAEARAARRGIWSRPEFQGALHITSFHANGRGDDAQDPNVEYLRVSNLTGGDVQLRDFTVRTSKGLLIPFPDFVIPAGYTAKVTSGRGENQTDPQRELTVHLQSAVPLWDDEHDQVEILDSAGNLVTYRRHDVK